MEKHDAKKRVEIIFDELRLKLKEKKSIFKLAIQIKMKIAKNSENKTKGKTEISKYKS